MIFVAIIWLVHATPFPQLEKGHYHTYILFVISDKCCSNKLLAFQPPAPQFFSPKFVPLLMLSICWWWSWSGEVLLFLFNLVFIELISNICANWCWVFVGHDLGQVQPLIFLQHDFSWISFKHLCQLMSSICWSWSWSGAGCSSPPPAHQSPKTCPQETATAPFASPVFFSSIFFLQSFTFSHIFSITQKKVLSYYSCCQRRCFISPGLLCSEAPCLFWCPSRYFVGSCPDLNKKTSISNMVTITHSVISSRNNHTSKLLMTTISKTLTNAMRLPFEHQI